MSDLGLPLFAPGAYAAAGRSGERAAREMIGGRMGPERRRAGVGAPAYFAARGKPKLPQDLTEHNCINLRLPTYGGIYAWEFEKRGRAMKVRVDGQLVFNTGLLRMNAVLAGLGLAYIPDDLVKREIADGRLIRVLADWCAPFAGYHLYYPSRRQPTPAFAVLVEALRYRK